MRAPCLLAWAKSAPDSPLQQQWPITADKVLPQITAVYDLTPSLLQLATGSAAGLPQPSDGRNLWPELAGGAAPADLSFLMHFPHEHRSNYFSVLRRGDWKLIYHWRRPAEKRFELFDLSRDPDESINLTEQEPEQLQTLALSLQQALVETGAQPPLAADQTTPLEFLMPQKK